MAPAAACGMRLESHDDVSKCVRVLCVLSTARTSAIPKNKKVKNKKCDGFGDS